MPEVTFIIGLCGSGKTTLAKKLSKENTHARLYMADTHGKYYYRDMRLTLLAGTDCIVEDICQSVEYYRRKMRGLLATVPGIVVKWIAFENDVRSANWNCAMRGKRDPKAHCKINRRLRWRYTIPNGSEVLPITIQNRIPQPLLKELIRKIPGIYE